MVLVDQIISRKILEVTDITTTAEATTNQRRLTSTEITSIITTIMATVTIILHPITAISSITTTGHQYRRRQPSRPTLTTALINIMTILTVVNNNITIKTARAVETSIDKIIITAATIITTNSLSSGSMPSIR